MTLQHSFDTSHAERALAAAAAQRERQLDELPPTHGDLVAEAHRASVARILAEIRAAQQRLLAGTYGTCTRCGARIVAERLEVRPWATHCAWCAG